MISNIWNWFLIKLGIKKSSNETIYVDQQILDETPEFKEVSVTIEEVVVKKKSTRTPKKTSAVKAKKATKKK